MRSKSWRDYQRDLKRQARLGAMWRQAAWLGPLAVLLGFTFLGVWHLASHLSGGSGGPIPAVQAETEGRLSKHELAALLGDRLLAQADTAQLSATVGERSFSVRTTIDPGLQGYAKELLSDSGALKGACVVLDPATGRILALASHNPGGAENLCLTASPAASLFKLVTAAAAIEERGLNSSSLLHYCGDPHGVPGRATLTPRRWGTRVTLAGAFARSINPVFGSLGALEVGGDALKRWGQRCGFNRPIPFELPLSASHLEVPADQVEVARIAAGYNRVTTITPVHAAMLAAAVVSGGRLPEPTLVAQVVDGEANTLYQPQPAALGRLFSARCAQELRRLMNATVTEGTCRRSLLPYIGRGGLAELEVGGKTGSISGEDGKLKYDWFAGYALEREGGKRLALAVVQMHGSYLGHRSPTIAAALLRRHFGMSDLALWKPHIPQANKQKAQRVQRRARGRGDA